ncbi:NrfD/PsrC family molybdoenzyme membrane anchor subunit [Chloroflexota bacterium]
MEKRNRFPTGILILSALVIPTLAVIFIRFINGLGAVSNLSDGRPWGLWISFDLYCGVALAAGGFTLAGIVYIFGREKYHSVARPAILTAFLGYTLVILALLVDLGQPWYIWHFFLYWNVHSPMFEVALCVTSYTVVLALEFSPAVFERLNEVNLPVVRRIKWGIPLKVVRAIQVPLVIAGIVLSTLHQSSLGSMLLIVPGSLHPLWYTPILPILFLVSAISVGPAMVIFETTISSRAFGHRLSLDIMSGLGKYLPYVLGIYLSFKVLDIAVAGELGLLFTSGIYSLLWWGEIIIGVVLPIILLSLPGVRQSTRTLFWCAVLVIAGLVFNRFNVSMLALAIRPGYTYSPHWMEVAISVGLIADAMLVIWLAHRFLPMNNIKKTSASILMDNR